MMEELIAFDKKLFLYLNSFHTYWLDPVMYLMSERYTWIPLYMFLLFLTLKKYRAKTWMIVLSVAIALLLSDQITSGFMKPFFARLRPSHEPALQNTVHLVYHYTGGLYGFASSHAANVFAIAMFFWLLFRYQHKNIAWLFVWALVVAYTRIYLGVHYPGDVLAGIAIGILSGWTGFRLFTWWHFRRSN